jgi:capsular exopolysaccharide synthesis family protein
MTAPDNGTPNPMHDGTQAFDGPIALPTMVGAGPADALVPMGAGAAGVPSGTTFSFGSFVRALRRRWLLALTLGLLLGSAGAVLAWWLRPPQYTAYALLRVASAEQAIIPNGSNNSDEAQQYRRTQVALLKSHLVIQEALRRPKAPKTQLALSQPDPVAWLEKEIQADILQGTELIKVSLTGLTKEDLADIVNDVKDAYLDKIITEERTQKLTQLNEVERICTEAETNIYTQRTTLKRLADTLRTVDPQALTVQQKIAMEEFGALKKELAMIQSQLRAAKVTLVVAEGKVKTADTVEIPPAMLESAVNKDPKISEQRTKVLELGKKLTSGLYTVGSPSYQRWEKELEKEKAELESMKKARAEIIKNDLRVQNKERNLIEAEAAQKMTAVLKGQEKEIANAVEIQGKEVEGIGKTSLELEMKLADLKQLESVVNVLRTEKERLSIEVKSNKKRVTSWMSAETPQQPSRTLQIQTTAAAGLGLFLLGLAGVGFWELRARRISDSQEVEQELGMRVLGTLPTLNCGSRARRQTAEDLVNQNLLVESIDAIRTMLLCDESVCSCRTLMVTSALSREGKTTLASHLATSIARAGRRTLLIDCDLRRPSVYRLFDLQPGPGVSEVVTGEASLDQAVVPAAVSNLWLLPAGQKAQEAIPALAQGRLQGLFQQLRDTYDFIILDTSPIVPVSDGLLIGKHADAVVLSLRSQVSQTTSVQIASERLRVLGIRILGAVVNGSRTRLQNYEYRYLLDSRHSQV